MSLEIKRQTIGRTVRNVFLCAIAALLLSSPAALAEWKGAMQGTIVWPADAAGWKITGEPVRYRGKAIFGYIDGAGEVFIAYNYKELTVRRFERKGLPAIVAEAYEMGSPQDAFGVFTWDKHDPEADIGQESEFGGGMLRFWKGSYFFSIFGEGEGKEQEDAVLEIGKKLASSVAEAGGPPLIMQALPEARRVPDTAKFVRSHVLLNQRCFISGENILRLTSETEVVFARYDFGKERTFLLLAAYPTQSDAEFAYSTFGREYKLNRAGMAQIEGAWNSARLEGRRIIIALHVPDEGEAVRLIDAASTRLKEVP